MKKRTSVLIRRKGRNKIFGDYKDTDEEQVSQGDIKVEMKSNEEMKYVDRELTEEEKEALKKFKENDEEIDAILEKVIVGLGELQIKGNTLNQQIDRQNEMLKKTNQKVERTHLRLIQQNNQLKDVLQKIRSTNKLCCDLCLVICFLGLIGVIVAVLKSKGYF